ncbi:hypothetical protein [Novosphingobium sp. HII-3]|uniref:hypothetical protein n=1 Tax=Novosphingobium sp. HII-3 TaxID=2075565 RepID=UPI0011AF004C|nr:hypothetical protein [Novosphingobium sp. HII-3]
MTYPRPSPDRSHDEHQNDMAAWMRTTVDAMNRAHDPLHRALAGFLGVESHALRMAAGEELTEREAHLAGIEEEAVLFCQRWLHQAGGTVP